MLHYQVTWKSGLPNTVIVDLAENAGAESSLILQHSPSGVNADDGKVQFFAQDHDELHDLAQTLQLSDDIYGLGDDVC